MRPGLRTVLFSVTPELVANGGFDIDANWTKGTGWSIGSGVATKVAGTQSSLSSLSFQNAVIGRTYACTYTLTISAGAIQPFIGAAVGAARTVSGTFTDYITATAVAGYGIFGNNLFAGTIDNVSVRRKS